MVKTKSAAKKAVKKTSPKTVPAKAKPAPKSVAKAKAPPPKPAPAAKKTTPAKGAKRTVAAIANFVMMAVVSLKPSPTNPRKRFDPVKLDELTASVREQGVIEPILVRPVKTGHEIVAGERRWRAAQKAGLLEVPCIVRELSERQTLEVQIAENLQRADMTPLEEADALARLQDEHKCTIFEISDKIGRPTKYVEQRLKIARLEPEVRELLDANKVGLGGALLLPIECVHELVGPLDFEAETEVAVAAIVAEVEAAKATEAAQEKPKRKKAKSKELDL